MKFSFSIDKTEIFENASEHRLYIVGWCLGNNGEIPRVSLYINNKLTRCAAEKTGRFDAYRAMEEVRRANHLKPFTGEVRERMIDEAGFVIGVRNYPEDFRSIALIAEYNGSTEIIFQMKEKEIRKKADRSIILHEIDAIGFNDKKKIYTVIGWYHNPGNDAVRLSVKDRHHNTIALTEKKEQKDTGALARVLMKEDEELTRFFIRFEGEKKEHYTLHMDAGEAHAEYTFTAPAARSKTAEAVGNFFHGLNGRNIRKFFQIWQRNGFDAAMDQVEHTLHQAAFYDVWFRRQRMNPDELEEQRRTPLAENPKISLLVPVYNTPVHLLKMMLDTVVEQTYGNWELCIADGSDEKNPARAMVRRYACRDPRIKVVYLDQNYGISGNTNKALELAEGDYIAMYDHDDFLELNALYEVARAINEQHCDILYTDEDKYEDKSKQFVDPNLKPDFSIDLLRSHNYITHLFVAKASIVHEIGGFRSAFDGAQDYDLILRCIEKTDRIYHLPKILYHWRIHEGSTAEDPESKNYAYEAGRKALEEHLERCGLKGTVEMLPKPYYGLYHVKYIVQNDPLVSILIPNYENLKMLKRCVDSLFEVNTYRNIEIIIIENNSHSRELFDYYEKVQQEHENVHVVTWSGGSFNFSAINNTGEKYAKGEYLLFLNNDTEMINPASIAEMVGMCQREEVGAVGAKLLYADNTVQHAGVVIGFGGTAGHVFHGIENKDTGYMMRALINTDYSAVTGACMMVKKDLFERVGGFDEELAVAFNDIDLCLKIREQNKLVVYNAFSLWHHYESVSRGYEESPEKKERFRRESAIFRRKWKKILTEGDPFYNANFDVGYTPFELH